MEPADLGALVLGLVATERCDIRQHMGLASQQCFLGLIGSKNPFLANELHADSSQFKPYSVSSLMSPGSARPLRGHIEPGAHAWLRLVGLRREVVACLDSLFFPQPWEEPVPETIEINRAPWLVEWAAYDSDVFPWAGRTTYGALSHEYQFGPPPHKVSLQFATPTTFRSDGFNIPLPMLELIFSNLAKRWDTLSGLPLPEAFGTFVKHLVVISQHCIETAPVKLKRDTEVGFTGQVTFTIKKSNGRLKKRDAALAAQLAQMHRELSRVLGLLASFAFYSGVGAKTTMGMGVAKQTKRLGEKLGDSP